MMARCQPRAHVGSVKRMVMQNLSVFRLFKKNRRKGNTRKGNDQQVSGRAELLTAALRSVNLLWLRLLLRGH